MDDSYRLRPASVADLGALVALEQAAFSDPWSQRQLGDALLDPGAISVIAESADGAVVGYLIGRVVLDEAEVLTLAVHPDARRHGVGRRMLALAVESMAGRGVRSVWLEVRLSNEGAQALYKGAGFVPSGLRRSYYRRPVEDAMVLTRDLSKSASARPTLR